MQMLADFRRRWCGEIVAVGAASSRWSDRDEQICRLADPVLHANERRRSDVRFVRAAAEATSKGVERRAVGRFRSCKASFPR